MERAPRNAKRDRLVTMKLMAWCYGMIGWIEGMGAMMIYVMVLNDYGVKPATIIGINKLEGYVPKDDDIYNPNVEGYGNSNYGNPDFAKTIDWTSN
jgi:hypothetical protein